MCTDKHKLNADDDGDNKKKKMNNSKYVISFRSYSLGNLFTNAIEYVYSISISELLLPR